MLKQCFVFLNDRNRVLAVQGITSDVIRIFIPKVVFQMRTNRSYWGLRTLGQLTPWDGT